MPLYEYRCGTCDRVFEAYRRLSDQGKETCPDCGGESFRVGISLVRAPGGKAGSSPGEPSCGGGPRRSPFR